MPPLTCGVLLLAVYMSFHVITAVADLCSGGSNIFTEIPENSPFGTLISHLTVLGDPQSDTIQLTLSGIDSEWFYLDGKTVRLNASEEKVLDREAMETPVLMVSFTCAEDGFLPAEYRIIVQVMNENDNKPQFQEDTILERNISELAPVHSVVFSTQAEDADGDTLIYVIDSTTADARYFRIDLPNSGKIVLAKALDFETKRHLEFVVHVVEMNTKERFNSSARIHVNVMDGDDQYPQFLPCNFLSHDGVSVCVSPIYTTNVTEGEVKTEPLQFLPGAIHAEDGDRDLKAAITYSILSGTDHGYFHIDNVTASITMLRPVESRVPAAVYSLSVMASQVNDAKKYVVTEVRVRILLANHHAPRFGRSHFQAFVHEDHKMASLVVTYSGRVLSVTVSDMDFVDGFNPSVRYSLQRQSNHTQLFQITPGGLLIARASHLHAFERYALQVIARDEESGETTNTTVNVEVLMPGQEVPLDPLEAGQQGRLDAGILAGSLGSLLLVTAIVLFLFLHAMKKRQRRQQNMERAALAMEKHPNVSLKWFQPVNAAKAVPETIYFQNEGYSDLGDEAPKGCGGQMGNSKPASGRGGKAVAARETPTANSVGRFEGQLEGQPRGGWTPEEQEDAGKAALLNGKAVEQLRRPTPCLEDEAVPKDSGDEQPSGEALAEAQVTGQGVEPLLPGNPVGSEEEEGGGAPGALEETPRPPDTQPQQKEEADACRGGSHEEPSPESPNPERDSLDGGGGGCHTDPPPQESPESPEPSQASPCAAAGNTELPVAQKDPGTSLPVPKEAPKEALEEASEEEEEEDGEETPKAASPTYQDPLAPLPVSDVRMPVTLLQLLEDSIEC